MPIVLRMRRILYHKVQYHFVQEMLRIDNTGGGPEISLPN